MTSLVSADSTLDVDRLCGHRSVMGARSLLQDLAATSQSDVARDLAFFLGRESLTRTPHLLLLRSGSHRKGALLLHERRPFGLHVGAFATSDRSGRSVCFGPQERRLQLALSGCLQLLNAGANVLMLSVQCRADMQATASMLSLGSRNGVVWAARPRLHPTYLPLENSLDATFASLGHRTRRNLRHYRRLAEGELGCRFLPEADLTARDLIAFSKAASFERQDWVLRWRLALRSHLHAPFLMGLQDRSGQWLSLVGGRRFGISTEVLWQLNRQGLPRHSLISAMRSYLLEHEIARGATRLYIEGGTSHSIQHAFLQEEVTDLVLVRKRWKQAVCRLAHTSLSPQNLLTEMVADPSISWHNC